nr:hypothetical protein [Rhizobium sp. ACO-34A]
MLPIDEETEALKRSIAMAVANVSRTHGVAEPEMAARDLAALTRDMVEAGGPVL